MHFSRFDSRPRQRTWAITFAAIATVACLGQVLPHPHSRGCLADDFPEVHNSDSDRDAEPMSAAEAAASMRVPAGFRVDLFASEPDVRNPIGIAWDERGRMWVAENYTYAERSQRFDLSLRDRVVILEDADGDGRAESRQVFTDNVQMLTSVEVGRGGVWLMCPPQLLFIPDADGDGSADGPPQVILDGFTVAKDNYHNFANGLRWGPDGWLYGRCGHSCPGRLGPPGTPDTLRVPIDGGIWRFSPERNVVEVLCHGTVNPWGHDWDKDGELFFINTVIGHLWHLMPGAHFKESFGESMNPLVYERLDMIADHYHFDTRGNWTESRGGKANDFGGGHAHVGMMIYQGGHWPKPYHDRLFTLNMHGYRANVERLERLGAGYVGKHEPDFLFATDPFFRGVEISTGPDGNVYVVDWSDTGECHEHTGVHRTSGRIYKVSYGEGSSAMPFTKPMCMTGTGPLPELWRAYQAKQASPSMLRERLSDPDEHVRVWAIRLLTDTWPLDTIEGPLPNATYPDDPESLEKFLQLAENDPSGLVLLTLASTLQRLPIEKRVPLAERLVARDAFANDRDYPLMLWYGLMPVASTNPSALLDVAKRCQIPQTLRCLAHNLMSQIDEHPELIDSLLKSSLTSSATLQDAVVGGMLQASRGWRKAKRPSHWPSFAASGIGKRSPEAVRELDRLFGDGRALDELRQIVSNNKASIQERQVALRTLIDARPENLRAICESVIEVRNLNGMAAKGLALFDDPTVGELLIRSYRKFDVRDRSSIIETLVSRRTYASQLLDHLIAGGKVIAASDLTPFHARQIRSLGDDGLNQKLSEVWGELRDTSEDKKQAIEQWKATLTSDELKQADLSAGRVLYNKSCAQCHVLYGEGGKVGPDLTGAQRSSLEYLLENIVDPSAVVGKDYRMTLISTVDGRVLSGLVVSRDAKTLVLQTQTDQQVIAIDEIEGEKITSLSPMPDGLLDHLTPDQTRDLIAYLMHPTQVEVVPTTKP